MQLISYVAQIQVLSSIVELPQVPVIPAPLKASEKPLQLSLF